jgi:hypothetical protein
VAKYFGSPEQAASTSVYGAVSKEVEGRGALYLEGTSIAGPALSDTEQVDYGHSKWAFNKKNEEKLWEVSKKLVGVE